MISALLSLIIASASGGAEIRPQCATLLGKSKQMKYTQPWKGAPRKKFETIEELNGILISEVTEFFAKQKRLPNEVELLKRLRSVANTYGYQIPTQKVLDQERNLPEAEQERFNAVKKNLLVLTIVKGLKEYYKLTGSADDLNDLLEIGLREIESKELMKLKDQVGLHLVRYFKNRLRMPSFKDIADQVDLTPKLMLMLIGDPNQFVEYAIRTHQKDFFAARDKLIKAFVRTISQQDKPVYARTQRNTPDMEQIYASIQKMRQFPELQGDAITGQFTVKDLEALFKGSNNGRWAFAVPSLFADLTLLESEARNLNPAAFRNYIDRSRFSKERALETVKAIEESPGFLITTAVAGVPIDEDQFKLMLKMAEDRKMPILVIPSLGITEGLDERLLNNPRIHIVTHTIENPYLKIWNIPIGTKNFNPFASLDLRKQIRPGQTVIVGHPQLAYEVKPTGDNHIMETSFWSTGAMTKNLYPSAHPMQKRTAEIAKNLHTNGFVLFEKADKKAGALQKGATNVWHARPVFYHDFRENGGEAFIVDMGEQYTVAANGSITKRKENPIAMEVGDVHEIVAHQDVMRHHIDFITENEIRYVITNDVRDGASHNRHEEKNQNLLIKKLKSGELDMHKEDMGHIQYTNAILSLPYTRVVHKDSNHHYWEDQVISLPSDLQVTVNGIYITELQHAIRNLRYRSTLEYLYNGRNDYLKTLPPEIKAIMEREAIPVIDPSRVRVLHPGEQFVLGPEYNPISHEHHGHRGNNGAKGSKKAHSSGSWNSNIGDSHTPAIWGGMINAGVSTPKRQSYSMGGYSSWNIAWISEYENSARQLILYNPLTQTYRQRPGVGHLAGRTFFGEHPLQVRDNDNDVLPDTAIVDSHSRYVDGQRKLRKGPKTEDEK